MSQYDKLDLMIFEAIKSGKRDFGGIFEVTIDECVKSQGRSSRDDHTFRVLDSRLQSLKRRQLIEFKRPIGWRVKDAAAS